MAYRLMAFVSTDARRFVPGQCRRLLRHEQVPTVIAPTCRKSLSSVAILLRRLGGRTLYARRNIATRATRRIAMDLLRGNDWRALFTPLALAAYLAILVVALSALRPAPVGVAPLWLTIVSLSVFTLGFATIMVRGECEDLRLSRLVLAIMLLAAFAIFCRGPAGLAGILFVLWASVLAVNTQGWRLLLILTAVNGALLLLLMRYWGHDLRDASMFLLGFASFQAFATLVMGMTVRAERDRDELARVNVDLLATRSLLAESVRDSERLRLSRELHDIAGHKLTALKLNLSALARDPRWRDEQAVALCAQLADELLADIRSVVQQLRLHDGIALREVLQALAAPFPKPRVHLELADEARVADLGQAEAVLRTVQEALTNTARHSNADNLWIVLRRVDGALTLDIRDDGRGAGELVFGNGLAGMRERWQNLGGLLRVQRGEHGGVQLLATLPARA
ncbi:sensor histidine kinase [Arenimonas sp.]|uniref:sensor histidine kinase n=1 Tax=Arenimonas sp. TaxID=1872635 RepID=UPI0039E354B1